jgi:hypothetical protein
MNNKLLRRYHHIVKQFPKKWEAEAIEGLISACNNINLPTDETKRIRYIKVAMKNKIRDVNRRMRKYGPQPVLLKWVGKKKIPFESFYRKWLGSRGWNDTLRRRWKAEEEFSQLVSVSPKTVEVNIDSRIYNHTHKEEGSDFSIKETLISKEESIENKLIEEQELLKIRSLQGIQDTNLRSFILPYIVNSQDKEDITTGLLLGVLHLVSDGSWKDIYRAKDVLLLCDYAHVTFDILFNMQPRDAKRYLDSFNKKRK